MQVQIKRSKNATYTEILIKPDEGKTLYDAGRPIHEQLKGNPDYVNNEIVLNIDGNDMLNPGSIELIIGDELSQNLSITLEEEDNNETE
ncbi:MAG: hypothetical protein NC489_38870 [Ruminococcus flavefaciens]|nr:hypothetical protein [Ruminococcus flavefaciens]